MALHDRTRTYHEKRIAPDVQRAPKEPAADDGRRTARSFRGSSHRAAFFGPTPGRAARLR